MRKLLQYALIAVLGLGSVHNYAHAADSYVTGEILRQSALAMERHEQNRPLSDDTLTLTRGISYIAGVSDAMTIHGAICNGPKTHGQTLAIVGKWLAGHPERWQDPGLIAVYAALVPVYPCKERR